MFIPSFGIEVNETTTGSQSAGAGRSRDVRHPWVFQVLWVGLVWIVGIGTVSAEEGVVFDRDIRPLLAKSCLRCHGVQKSKGGLRLDTREGLLKGGDSGAAWEIGQGRASRLVQYAAHQVPDMEMPPLGQGTPWTQAELTLVSQWLEQGASYDSSTDPVPGKTSSSLQANTTAGVGQVWVHGNPAGWQRLTQSRPGSTGGLTQWRLMDSLSSGSRWEAEGVLNSASEHYRASLSYEGSEGWYSRVGWETYREYDDGWGVPLASGSPRFDVLGSVPFLERRQVWLDWGRVKGEESGWEMGYHLTQREGSQSAGFLGATTDGGGTLRSTYPGLRYLDETVQRFHLEVRGVMGEWRWRDRFEGTLYDFHQVRTDTLAHRAGSAQPDRLAILDESQRSWTAANTLTLRRPFRSGGQLSAGYVWIQTSGSGVLDQSTQITPTAPAGPPGVGDFFKTTGLTLRQSTHAGSTHLRYELWDHWVATAGLQADWSRREGMGNLGLDFGIPGGALFAFPSVGRSDWDEASVSETLALRWRALPNLSWNVESRFQQTQAGQFEWNTGVLQPFLRDTDISENRIQFASAVSWNVTRGHAVRFSGGHREWNTDYGHRLDQGFGGFPDVGYPAFLRSRAIGMNHASLRWTWNPKPKWRSQWTYDWEQSSFRAATEPIAGVTTGQDMTTGLHRVHRLAWGLSWQPSSRWNLGGGATFERTQSSSATPSTAVIPYQGHRWQVHGRAAWALNPSHGLDASLGWGQSRFGRPDWTGGLPLGVDSTLWTASAGWNWKMGEERSLRLQYQLWSYAEPSSARLADFSAHGLFLTTSFAWGGGKPSKVGVR